MNRADKDLLLDLALNRISKKAFNNRYTGDLSDLNKHLGELLNQALQTKDPEEAEYAMLFGFTFELFDDNAVHLKALNELLLGDWHYKHEDIVRILQDLKRNESVEPLYQTALKRYQYLNYDDQFGLARKCTWALSKINTPDAVHRLKLLSECANPIICSYAEKRLNERHNNA